jgi:cobalt-zinc-cadmium resistance protein CzcA
MSWGGCSPEREEVLRERAAGSARPVAFGVGIIMIVFLPILTLEGIEGKLFKPMALTHDLRAVRLADPRADADAGAGSLFLPKQVKEKEPWLVRLATGLRPGAGTGPAFPAAHVAGRAGRVVRARCLLATRMGGEFLPKLGEAGIVGTTVRLAGISVDEAVAQNDRIERVLMAEFPDEIEHIWTRLGTAEVATDPMGVELADFFLALKPREQWKKARTQGS